MSVIATPMCLLNTSRHGDSTTCSQFQHLTILSVIFPNIQSKLCLCNLAQFLLVLSLAMWETNPHLVTTSFQVVLEIAKVLPEPPFLQTKPTQLPQPLPIWFVLQPLHELHCSSEDMLHHRQCPCCSEGPKTSFTGHHYRILYKVLSQRGILYFLDQLCM